jgi:ribosome-associated protein
MIDVDGIHVAESELSFAFARSGGPGGQNVNKVSSKVILRWNVAASAIRNDVKQRFTQAYGNRINDAGELVLDCDETRSQHQNREIVVARLRDMLARVARPPKKRIATKPGKAVKARRRKSRERESQKKQMRRKVEY